MIASVILFCFSVKSIFLTLWNLEHLIPLLLLLRSEKFANFLCESGSMEHRNKVKLKLLKCRKSKIWNEGFKFNDDKLKILEISWKKSRNRLWDFLYSKVIILWPMEACLINHINFIQFYLYEKLINRMHARFFFV